MVWGASATKSPIKDAQRLQLKKILLKVHPDKFSDAPVARTINTNSLKLLNDYLDRSSGMSPRGNSPVKLDFCVKPVLASTDGLDSPPEDVDNGLSSRSKMRKIQVVLPAVFCLKPLFEAFGIEALADKELDHSVNDEEIVSWLRKALLEAREVQKTFKRSEHEIEVIWMRLKEQYHLLRCVCKQRVISIFCKYHSK